MEYTHEQRNSIMEIFNEYERRFGENLCVAWDYDAVDWLEYSKIVKKCLDNDVPISEEQKNLFIEHFKPGLIY